MKTTSALRFIHWLFPILCLSIFNACSGDQKAPAEEEASASEDTLQSEWMTLFDGKTLNGWKRYNAAAIGSLWKVEDGTIVCYSEGGGEADIKSGGSLITTEQFDNFELVLDWKISPGGNSGILYHIVEKPEYSHAYVTGPEYQLVDDAADASEEYSEEEEARKTAANYDMYAPSRDKPVKPAGEWNTAKIVYNNGHVEHWLNGRKVLEFEEGGEDWKARYEKSKWPEYPGWCQYKSGAIGLQDHGNHTWFRNIRVRRL